MNDSPTRNDADNTAKPAGSPPPPPQANSSTTVNPEPESQSRKRGRCRNLHKAPIWIEAACAVALVVITGFYTHFAHQQVQTAQNTLGEIIKQYPEIRRSAEAAKAQAEVSAEALHSVQRAFVTFAPSPEITYYAIPGKEFYLFTMPINNIGITPAHGLKDRVSWIAPMYDLPDDYAFPDRGGKYGTPHIAFGAHTVGPKEMVFSQNVMVPPKVLEEFVQQNSLKHGPIGVPSGPARHVVFYGWATYRDIFKDTPRHLTEFCRYLSVFAIKPHGGAEAQWGYCPYHNCTDEDCPDYKQKTLDAP